MYDRWLFSGVCHSTRFYEFEKNNPKFIKQLNGHFAGDILDQFVLNAIT